MMSFVHMFADVAAQVTTTTSTNLPVAAATKMYDLSGVIYLVGAVIMATLTIIGGVIGIIEFKRKTVENRKKHELEQDAPIVSRIVTLEESIKFFRHRDEVEREFRRLEDKVDHNKANTSMILEGLNNRLTNVSAQIADEQRVRAKIEAQVENLNENIKRVESAIDRQGDRMEERFDKLSALVVTKQA